MCIRDRPREVHAGRCTSLGRAVKPSEEMDPLPAGLCGLLVADLLPVLLPVLPDLLPVLPRHNNTAPGALLSLTRTDNDAV